MKISVKNLTHIYNQGQPDETLAIDDVSFEIDENEFVGIIGHTGSGKSTLIQHINGILKPDSGQIFVGDTEITAKGTQLRDIRKRVGLVFQYPEYQLFEETVAQDVAFGPGNLGLSREASDLRVREALQLVGLDFEEIADRSPFELSGGQKRRAAIAGVIAMQPDVLILDEPVAGLDPKAHRDILEMIVNIRNERKCTVMLVSHNMDDVAALCDRVLVMDKGRLVLNGTPEDVFAQEEKLRSMGLGLPSATELLYAMKSRGADIDTGALDVKGAAEKIAEYLEKKR